MERNFRNKYPGSGIAQLFLCSEQIQGIGRDLIIPLLAASISTLTNGPRVGRLLLGTHSTRSNTRTKLPKFAS